MDKITTTFQGLTNLQKILVLIILATFTFAASTSLSLALFSKVRGTVSEELGGSSVPTASNALVEDPSEPKTESCPLNGRMHTKKAKDAWEKRRPLAVMIENHSESRPQSGLSYADVIYEAVAEGGITRFMGVFYCDAAYKSV